MRIPITLSKEKIHGSTSQKKLGILRANLKKILPIINIYIFLVVLACL